MRRLLPIALASALLLACGPPFDEAGPGDARGGRAAAVVRVATWNVHDLFDEVDRLVPPGDADAVLSAGEVEEKLSRLAAVLVRLRADVVLLQEVENRGVLDRLAARAGYSYARLVEGGDPRGIDVAALSRLPIERYVSHLGEVDLLGRPLWPRDCVEIHARAGGHRVVVVGSHLSSALSDDGTRRTEQARRLREIADAVRAEIPGAVVLAGGDLNDHPLSAALSPLLADGTWLDAAPPGAITWSGASAGARLDYLLVAREDALAMSSFEIVAGADVGAASDHRPVIMELRLE